MAYLRPAWMVMVPGAYEVSKDRKRKKTKRNVRCTMCTQHRWFGNNKGRFKDKEEDQRKNWKKYEQQND